MENKNTYVFNILQKLHFEKMVGINSGYYLTSFIHCLKTVFKISLKIIVDTVNIFSL